MIGVAVKGLYVVIGYYQSMGSLFSYCSPNIGDQYLTLTLLKAAERAKITIANQEHQSINKHIKSQSKEPLQLNHCNLVFQDQQQQQPKELKERQQPMLPNEARLVVKTYDSPKHGMIVYQNGYFIGRLDKNRANGEGEMFLIGQLQTKEDTQILRLFVQGTWNNDILTQGRVFNRTQDLLLTIKWIKQLREINVKFTKGEIAEYTGEGEFTQASTLQEMLTGKCKIVFKDKSVYTGTIFKGKLDTQRSQEQEGIFQTAEEKYKGSYVSGMRHGRSLIQRKQDGYLLTYQLTWNMGVPDLTTLKLLSSDPRATLFRTSSSHQQ